MSGSKPCFLVCEGCGPAGLYDELSKKAQELKRGGCSFEVRQASCLLACRFKKVVKVLDADGLMTRCYSGVARNGFEAFGRNPLKQLLDRHVSN